MNKEEAWKLVCDNVKNKALRKHMIAVAAVMKIIAEKYGDDQEKWELAGLLHDLDYDSTIEDFDRHGFVAAEILAETDVTEDVIYAIKSHTGQVPRKSLMDKVLYAADPITGLIVAAALVTPDKKLSSLKPKNILNRFKEKHFAKGANREQIKTCEEFDLSLENFIELSLKAMQNKASELGL